MFRHKSMCDKNVICIFKAFNKTDFVKVKRIIDKNECEYSLAVFKDCSLEEDEIQETSGSPEEKCPAFSSSSSGASGLCPRHLPATRDVLPTFTFTLYFIHEKKLHKL